MTIKRIGILYHPMIEAARKLAGELEKFLAPKVVSVWLCSAWESEQARARLNSTDLIVTSGGDGTILRAVQVALPTHTPIIGINLGKLGFMTELNACEAPEKLLALLDGQGWIDERAILEIELTSKDKTKQIFHALNDAVVARGAIARLINVETSIDGKPLTNYRADGVIVSTATGSTGYSLAAGGPILHPSSKEILLVPITVHLGLAYKMVLPPDTVVGLRVDTKHEATLSVDGHINLPLASGSVISVRRSPHITRFLRIHPEDSFYSSLEQKLRGKKEVV